MEHSKAVYLNRRTQIAIYSFYFPKTKKKKKSNIDRFRLKFGSKIAV